MNGLEVRDDWGQLQASEGALVASDFSRVVLAAPARDGQAGPGWTLTLNAGYRIVDTGGGALTIAR